MCGDLATKRVRLDVVSEGLDAVDLDDGDQLAVPRFELGVPADVDLPQVEVQLVVELRERRPRPLAQVAAVGVVEDDFSRYG